MPISTLMSDHEVLFDGGTASNEGGAGLCDAINEIRVQLFKMTVTASLRLPRANVEP
jgi:hypothetical protein